MKDDDELFGAEDLFGEVVKSDRPKYTGRRRAKKAQKDLFAEIKVRMVMRIYNISRARAIKIIAGRAAEKKALEAAGSPEAEKHNGNGLMSAEDFFGDCG